VAGVGVGWVERGGVVVGLVGGCGGGRWEGLRRWGRELVSLQGEMAARHGRVVGCPLHALGAEISMQEEGLRRKVGEILERYVDLVDGAIRRAEPAVRAEDAAVRARRVFAYVEGLLTQARIANDLRVLEGLEEGVVAIAQPREVAAVA